MEDTDETGLREANIPPAQIHIRAANLEDADDISRILAEAFPALYHWIFGRFSTQQTAGILCALYRAETLSLSTTRLAIRDGHVIGVTILHIGESIGRGTLQTYWRVACEKSGFWKGIRAFVGGVFANFAINKRIPKGNDLVYVEALAVDERERGKGIGTLLMQDALQWAQANGRGRMALHVLQGNMGARRLYARMGFRLHSPEPRPAAPGSRQRWVSLLMLRDPQ